jgi:hydroxymethylbilane synthase
MREIVIGTRGSALALWQTHKVRGMLVERFPAMEIRVEVIHTTGDRILDTALNKIGDKGLFTKELEVALEERRIDMAVHSLKDMPSKLPDGLLLAAISERHRPEDALVAAPGVTIESLPSGGTVATSSLRRRAQLLHLRPDLTIVDVRGNVPTRLEKFRASGWDGMILATAGLERLDLGHEIAQVIPASTMVPAVGQGALAVETRGDDEEMLAILDTIEHRPTRLRTTAERALLRTLEGGCQVPIGAYATLDGETLRLDGLIAALDGSRLVRDIMTGPADRAEELGIALATKLLAAGGEEILASLRQEVKSQK